MPPTLTPLAGRSKDLLSALFALLVVMGISPLFEIFAVRWPLRFGEVRWRFQTLQLLLANGPQFVILIGVVALMAILIDNRVLLRSASVALWVMAGVTFAIVPFFVLDFLQIRRLVPQDTKPAFNVATLKTLGFAGLLVLGSAWTALVGWRVSEPSERAARRHKQGEGLVVGQPKEPRPPT